MASIGKLLDVTTIHPTKDRILVTRYERPATTPGGLHIPAAFRTDGAWAYWEVVAWGPTVKKALGIALGVGDIIRTPFRPAIDLGAEDAAGRRLFIVPAENVNGVIQNTWDV